MMINGDSLEIMRSYPENHFTGIVTDSPFGISFMGKDWDRGIPSIEYWAEMLRICKPGSFMLAAGLPRMIHRLGCVIEDSGWQIRDMLMHIFGSGFPKSHNHFGIPGYGTALKPAWEGWLLCMKPCDGTFKNNAEKWGQAGINIDSTRIPIDRSSGREASKNTIHKTSGISFEGNKKETQNTPLYNFEKGRWPANLILDEFDEQIMILKDNIPNDIIQVIQEYFYDYRMSNLSKKVNHISQPIDEGKRKILQQEMLLPRIIESDEGRETFHVGQEPYPTGNSKDESTTQENRQGQSEIQGILDGQRLPIREYRCSESRNESNGSSDDQTTRNSGTSDNNGYEARSTTETIGSGASRERDQRRQSDRESGSHGRFDSQKGTQGYTEGITCAEESKRRLEVIACDIPEKWMKYFDETEEVVRSPHSAAAMLDEQSGISSSTSKQRNNKPSENTCMSGANTGHVSFGHNDSGGASRFFYVAKASSAERNRGCEGLPDVMGPYDPEQKGGEGLRVSDTKLPRKNAHPTVKPLKLMEYLVKLIAPPSGALILDPFAGPGTTLIACKNLGIDCVGIEKSAEYCEIANARLTA